MNESTFRVRDLKDGLQTVLDQLEAMGFPFPLCADFTVTIINRKGSPEFSVSFPVVHV